MANIKVILQQNVKNVGRIADEVSVKAGFARNYLLPRDVAVVATEANRAVVEAKRAELEKQAAAELAAAQARAEPMQGVVLNMPVQAMEDGKLYGSVGVEEIVEAMKAAGHEVAKHEVILPDGPIKVLGESTVSAALHPDVTVSIQVIIEAAE